VNSATLPPGKRSTYRHGDLRRALVEAGLELARAGGPDAVVLRAATRRAGVVPNAAYRHFSNREALLRAVRAAAAAALAGAIEAELAALPPVGEARAVARARLRAVGAAYLHFARTQTGLFRTAFHAPRELDLAPGPEETGPGGLTPLQLLGRTLDDLVAAGVLTPIRRDGAEVLAWSAVHGLAMLIVDGPLHALPPAQARALADRLLDMVVRGL